MIQQAYASAHLPRQPMRAVIIDLDGTMLDTGPDFHAAINAMRSEFDLPALQLTQITDLVGKGSENLVLAALALGSTKELAAQRFNAGLASYQAHYLQINGQYSQLYPQVIEGLQAMRAQGLRLACVTNKPVAFAKPLLAQFALSEYFELVYGGDSWPRKKPDPMPLLQVCETFVLAPSSVLMLGDSSNDAQAARAAGCPVWILPYGFNHGESVHQIDSDGIVPTLFEAAKQLAVHRLRAQLA